MKIEIAKHNLIALLPENDADTALLNMWSEQETFIAGSSFTDGEATQILIRFKSHKKEVEKD